MFKTVILKLINIKYSGNSIGNDVRVEINALNNFISVDKKIKKGQSVACQETVGQFFVDGKFFNPEIKITVIEKDLFFNDVGSISVKLKIDLEKNTTQINKCQVEVYEKRGRKKTKSKRGVFDLTLEPTVKTPFVYVPETKDGWLVVLDRNGEEVSLPSYLKVEVKRRELGREYFTILEGALRGGEYSVKCPDDISVFMINDNHHTKLVQVTYSISNKILCLSDKKYQTTDYEGAPWVKGLYDIEIPDFPHPGGLYYDNAKNPTVWFRVGHSGERYIHTGRHSLGCITVLDQKKWGEIYNILIRARKGDGQSIGVLEVIE
ncbi:MAG: hypothetical protein US58_C0012G0036 [Candidatus Magasanikbacteria bacterium GW2011_GWA2_37_8]|uniref:Uncharacterized protein n=1 Tax=Candidatus Magasanikbacteria bacterium GW2011_GWA2_37_8 TaxID=1619036 RepID=A0A0G0HF39_9BACT|nr:MAG: hypothetical protein US58_C0012G0036 [Candidatus Magasanikbacteria bacterium GW2011_GWA2_37_8]